MKLATPRAPTGKITAPRSLRVFDRLMIWIPILMSLLLSNGYLPTATMLVSSKALKPLMVMVV